jgi:hypothetical protein
VVLPWSTWAMMAMLRMVLDTEMRFSLPVDSCADWGLPLPPCGWSGFP